jgi:hypothetical protein
MLDRTTGGSAGQGRRLYFGAGGRVITAEICNAAIQDLASRLFPHYEIPVPGRDFSEPPDVRVEEGPNGYLVATGDEPSVACGTEVEVLATLEFALTRAIVASWGDHIHLHASGAVVNGQAVLALGRSGAGKSSLAVSWLSQGLKTLGDDIVLVNSAAMAKPFRRFFKVAPETLRNLGIDPATTFQWDPGWPEAWYAPDDGPGWATETPVAVLAFVQYDPRSALSMTPLSMPEALNSLVHSLMDTGKRASECFDTLMRLVENARVLRVEYPSADEAAKALSSLTI